jgi:hypothetical protein
VWGGIKDGFGIAPGCRNEFVQVVANFVDTVVATGSKLTCLAFFCGREFVQVLFELLHWISRALLVGRWFRLADRILIEPRFLEGFFVLFLALGRAYEKG